MASRDMRLITLQLAVSSNTSEWHNETNGCAIGRHSVPPGSQPGHCLGVHDLRCGLCVGAVNRAHLTFFFELSVEINKRQVTPRP
jgi:hypothetical protein